MAIDTTDTLEIDVEAFGNLAMADDAFPTEIYGIIGQFLAGDAAFGTLASVNTANHSIRDETLPMLYETVCFKSVSDIPECSSDQYLLPERFRRTKFIMVWTGIIKGRSGTMPRFFKMLPNLAMSAITTEQSHEKLRSCNVYLHQPLRPPPSCQ